MRYVHTLRQQLARRLGLSIRSERVMEQAREESRAEYEAAVRRIYTQARAER